MINRKHKFIFIHIPKCGGISISKSSPVFEGKKNVDAHLRNIDYNKRYKKIDNYFRFAFVRNPWARMVSTYVFWKNQTPDSPFWKWDSPRTEFIRNNKLDFNSFIQELSNRNPVFFKDQRCSDWRVPHTRPCWEYVQDESGRNWGTNFIGKVENMQDDFQDLCSKIGLKDLVLPHVNSTEHAYYADFYWSKTRKQIAQLFDQDIARFHYKFNQ